MKKEIVDNDEILNTVKEVEEEDRTIKDVKKDYPDKIKELEDVLLIRIGENDPKVLKQEFPDKGEHLTKKN